MKRFFAFGCSFTNYAWSTWADIIGAEFDISQNWGQTGAGNQYIFNSIVEANQRHCFGPNDTVVVCWTNVMREDRYIENRWVTLGNVATSNIFTKEFVADAVCERGMLIRDLVAMQAGKILLEHAGCNWHYTSLANMKWADPYNNVEMLQQDVFDLYQDVLTCLRPSFIDVLGFEYWYRDRDTRPRHSNGGLDYHPTPAQHLQWVDSVFPGWVTKQETRSKIAQENLNIQRWRSGNCKLKRL